MKLPAASRTLLVVARQAGTANAFAPLIRSMEQRGWQVRSLAFEHALARFAAHGITATGIERFDRALLGEPTGQALLLTGTSECADEDALFWQWAVEQGITSLAFVDSWVAYWQRFTPKDDPQRRFAYLPNRIAVIDRLMYDRMVQSGCRADHLVITGNPAFDALREYLPREKERIRASYGDGIVLFVGEPFNANVFGADEKGALGYTEAEVVSLAARAVAQLSNEQDRMLRLLFVPHPRGGLTPEVRGVLEHHRLTLHDGTFSSLELAACAHVVVGMTSMLLFEAAAMGIPTLSIRPEGKLASDVIDSCCGILQVASSRLEDSVAALEAALNGRGVRPTIATSTLSEIIERTPLEPAHF